MVRQQYSKENYVSCAASLQIQCDSCQKNVLVHSIVTTVLTSNNFLRCDFYYQCFLLANHVSILLQETVDIIALFTVFAVMEMTVWVVWKTGIAFAIQMDGNQTI